MTKSSIKRFSLVGLVLVAASAVTAAVIPSKPGPGQQGRLLANASTAGGVMNQNTCVPDSEVNQCKATDNSGTTNVNGNTNGSSAAASTSSVGANNTTNGFGNTNN